MGIATIRSAHLRYREALERAAGERLAIRGDASADRSPLYRYLTEASNERQHLADLLVIHAEPLLALAEAVQIGSIPDQHAALESLDALTRPT